MGNLVLSTTDDARHRRVSMLITGKPKIGKTTLATTVKLEDDSELFYVAADPGQLALRARKFHIATPNPGQKVDVNFLEDVYKHAAKNVADGKYKWVVVDGLDVIGDRVLQAKMKSNANGLKAYGEMAEYMEDWIFRMRDLSGANVIMLTHVDTVGTGEDISYVPMIPGQQIVKKINGWFDEVGCYRFVKTGEHTQERVIQFHPDPDPRYQVGDRSGALNHFEKPDLQLIFDKIHNAGLITEGEAKAVVEARSVEDMKDLQNLAMAAKLTNSEVVKMAAEIGQGRSPKFLTDDEYKQLCNKLKEKA